LNEKNAGKKKKNQNSDQLIDKRISKIREVVQYNYLHGFMQNQIKEEKLEGRRLVELG